MVSIITPSFNQGAFIEQTIKSVLSQDYPKIEHIVIDGGSTDKTLEVLKKYPHLKWISEADEGQTDALNKGFHMATGEVLAWINSDDYYLPGAISSAVKYFEGHPRPGLVSAGLIEVDSDGKEINRRPSSKAYDLSYELDVGNSILQPSTFISREALEAVGFLDKSLRYAMDYDLWTKIGLRFPVRMVDEYWSAFRFHGDSKTVSETKSFKPEERRVSRRYGGRLMSKMAIQRIQDKAPLAGKLLYKLDAAKQLARKQGYRQLWLKLKKKLGKRR